MRLWLPVFFTACMPVRALADEGAAPAETVLRVGIIQFPPCVSINGDGVPEGFDIDIWEELAKGLNRPFEYVEIDDFSKTFDYIRDGHIDVAISGIAITREREEMVDFSHTYLKSGISVLTTDRGSGHEFSMRSIFLMEVLRSFLQSMNSSVIFQMVIMLLVLVLAFGHLLYFLELFGCRIAEGGVRRPYFPGIFDATYYVVLSFSTGCCNTGARPILSRSFTVGMVMVGICYFSVFTALLSANFTFEKIRPAISSPDDLDGRIIATEKGTSSYEALERLNVEILTVDSIDRAYDLLLRGKVEAVVYDTPSLLYFASTQGGNKLVVLPEPLKEEYYAIAAREKDPVVEAVNRQLMAMYEDGRYQSIYNDWFGN